jgi:hypothetical protein
MENGHPQVVRLGVLGVSAVRVRDQRHPAPWHNGPMLKSAAAWFVLLAAVCVAAPYLLHVRPTNRRQWVCLGVTIGFLAWVLLFMVPVRSR